MTRMMNNLYWWGIPTLFRCPHEDVAGADTLVGVPHSTGNGTTERDQHLGPVLCAIFRHCSVSMAVSASTRGAWRGLLMPVMSFPKANDNEDCIERITAFYQGIDAAGARPVSIGGDHSITGGIVEALGGGNLSAGEPVAFFISMPILMFSPRLTISRRTEIGGTLGRLSGRSGQG